MGREVRWSIVVFVLAIAGIVALWPRGSGDLDGSAGSGDSSASAPAGSDRAAGPGGSVPEPESELAPQRARAALRSCPAPTGAAGPDALAGVRVLCLSDGSEVDLGAGIGDRPALINVWATWCEPCRRELPALQAYSERPGSVPVLGVQAESAQSGGLSMLSGLGVHFPSVADPDRTVQRALHSPKVLPASYVVRPDGQIRRLPPQVFDTPEEVDAAVQRELAGGEPAPAPAGTVPGTGR